jgi:disulfide bond formation protein DsbB
MYYNASSKNILVLLTLICAGVVGTAYIMQHVFDVKACQLCYYERYVYLAAGGIALFSLFFVSKRFHLPIINFALGVIFFGGFLLASYHVAIQQHWVSTPSFCASNDFSSFESVDSLRAQLMQTPFVRCDQITWSLFGLSLAAYNAIFSLILALACWKWTKGYKR